MNEAKEYNEYLRSDSWRKKRDARLVMDNNACRLCDEDGTHFRLEVHHRPSSYRKIPNESIHDDLVTLCSRCHDLITSAIRSDRFGRQKLPPIEVVTTVSVRTEESQHGMANTSVHIDIIGTTHHAQRPDGKSPQSLQPGNEEGFRQAQQDRRRSLEDGGN